MRRPSAAPRRTVSVLACKYGSQGVGGGDIGGESTKDGERQFVVSYMLNNSKVIS